MTIPSTDTLSALFLADPLTLTDAQLTDLHSELRRRRSTFHAEEAAKAIAPSKGRTPRTAASIKGALGGALADLTLDDL